jgi:hypothetical protein
MQVAFDGHTHQTYELLWLDDTVPRSWFIGDTVQPGRDTMSKLARLRPPPLLTSNGCLQMGS